MVAADSTSYPTLAVIQRYGFSGEAARLLWDMSDRLGAAYWSGDQEQLDDVADDLRLDLMALQTLTGLPEISRSAHDHLWRNVARAVRWAKENARG